MVLLEEKVSLKSNEALEIWKRLGENKAKQCEGTHTTRLEGLASLLTRVAAGDL